jgi:hypothetical protein
MDLLLPIVLTCAQASVIVDRLHRYDMPRDTRNHLVWEVRQVAPASCRFRDANAD